VNLRHWNSPFRDPFKIQTSVQAWRFLSNHDHVVCDRAQIASFINRQVTQARFKQALVLFWPPDITSEQDKQIHSFDELETHTRSIVLVGVDSASC